MKRLVLLACVLAPSIAAAQPAGYYNQPQDPWMFHNGLTFEGNLGFGTMVARVDKTGGVGGDASSSDSRAALGANLGIGGFITPQIALSLRIASVSYSYDANDGYNGVYTDEAIFAGPSIQYWINDKLWIGGGIGYAIEHVSYSADDGTTGDSTNDPTGVALDLRGGFTFWKSMRNSLNVSVEYTPGFYGEEDRGALGKFSYQLNGFAVLFGYQYL